MIKNKDYKVALVLYTTGVDYDDRIRKEIVSIRQLYPNISFKIFAITPDNKAEEGVTSYGVPYKIPYLKSRDIYAPNTHALAKSWDLYKTIKKEIRKFDAVWCADTQVFLTVLLTWGKPLVWDLHELPLSLMGSPVKRSLFRMAERKTKVTIHANEPRLKHLEEIGLIKDDRKQFVLRNYPQFDEIDSDYDEQYHKFEEWLGEEKCVYLQGLNDENRADIESVEAVLAFSELKAVIIGKIYDERKKIMEKRFGEELYKRCYFTGQIKQLKTPQYIRKCCMSLVFYKNSSPNNWYCEPNRLFQNLMNGNPVVVGNNPPMKELVEKYGVGVCADTDGSDVVKIIAAIKSLNKNINEITTRVQACKNNWHWDSQETIMKEIVNKWL